MALLEAESEIIAEAFEASKGIFKAEVSSFRLVGAFGKTEVVYWERKESIICSLFYLLRLFDSHGVLEGGKNEDDEGKEEGKRKVLLVVGYYQRKEILVLNELAM